jgi:hypothetical protein
MKCPIPPSSLDAWLEGALEANDDAAIAAHLEECLACEQTAGRLAARRNAAPDFAGVLAAVAATDPTGARAPLPPPRVAPKLALGPRVRHAVAAAAIAAISFTAGWFLAPRPKAAPRDDTAEVLDLLRRSRPVADAVLYRARDQEGETRDVTFAANGRRLEERRRDETLVSVGVVTADLEWTFVPAERKLAVSDSRPSSSTPDLFDPATFVRRLESDFVIESVRNETVGGALCRVVRARPRGGGEPIEFAADAASGVLRRIALPSGSSRPLVLDLVGPRTLDPKSSFNLWDYAAQASAVDCDWRGVRLVGVPPTVFVQTMVMVIDGSPGSQQTLQSLPPEIRRAVREAAKELDPTIRKVLDRVLAEPESRPDH